MRATKLVTGLLLVPYLLLAAVPAKARGKPVRLPPTGYKHEKFAPEADILKVFRGSRSASIPRMTTTAGRVRTCSAYRTG